VVAGAGAVPCANAVAANAAAISAVNSLVMVIPQCGGLDVTPDNVSTPLTGHATPG
jgi:hypothetical protein